ncbi:MAG: hypothetical protein AABY11_01945, partial [archaeon]
MSAIDDSFGDQNTVVILANFLNDSSEPMTPEEIRGIMFNDSDSLDAYYREASFSNVSFSGQVYGWYTMPINATCINSSIFFNAVSVADQDVYFPPYSRVVIVHPQVDGCGFGGAGTIGQSSFGTDDGWTVASKAWINRDWTDRQIFRHTIVHELGHNLGLNHAKGYECSNDVVNGDCSIVPYADEYDVMGHGVYHFNAPHKEYLEWLNSDSIETVTTSGIYTIEPIESISSGKKSLKVPKEFDEFGNALKWYYLEYRQPLGFDSTILSDPAVSPTAVDGVLVHFNPETTLSNTTLLLDMTVSDAWTDVALTTGTTYTDSSSCVSFTPIARTP